MLLKDDRRPATGGLGCYLQSGLAGNFPQILVQKFVQNFDRILLKSTRSSFSNRCQSCPLDGMNDLIENLEKNKTRKETGVE